MKLTDGQVMDFTKHKVPVLDHRWAAITRDPVFEEFAGTRTPTSPEEAAIQEQVISNVQELNHIARTKLWPESTKLEDAASTETKSCIVTIPTTGPLMPETVEPYDPWRPTRTIPSSPGTPFVPQVPQPILQPFMAPIPSFPSVQPWPDPIDVLRDKVTQRKEALSALDTDSVEVRGIIKTLDWVLQEIVKSKTVYVQGNVTFTSSEEKK